MQRVTVRPAGRENEVAGHLIRLRPQRHSDTSVAFRLDDELVIATDTPPDPEAVAFAQDAGLWLHEAWYWAGDPGLADVPEQLRPGYAAHSEATAAAGLAAEAAVDRLVFVHLNPLSGEAAYLQLRDAAREVFPRTDVVDDGTVVTAGASV
jgi:ribonuclease BN (tRNA processing enzyme)